MAFFSNLIHPYRKGERNFERGRAAEFRRDFDAAQEYFKVAAESFDEHIAKKEANGKEVRPSHLTMAGICYTRIGRYEDALRVLDQCMERKEVPDAFLHAGYAAAKMGDRDKAVAYWKGYPAWAGQRVIANALKEQIQAISAQDTPDLQGACEAMALAIFEQDRANSVGKKFSPYKPVYPANRKY